ncbi:MAG: hypothetical protein AYP45_12235 [Candidatus Brocadia carolinensis]|uniref:Protein kinase domain-containing protein n=1 Tax=Candidatus Brocadia carolinensis TaxID=1004156 RepID=A0A1V4ARY7_9BACT|nr:MAG: hypothetical protein AYP45_12235 [Candidatus Brocadia caroliniensis]
MLLCKKQGDLNMYSIDKYQFKEFKIAPGHRANYAILCNSEFKENQWGMKYSPANNYSREYKILPLFTHPQIPVRHKEGNAIMYKEGKSVITQNYLIITHFEGADVVEYYQKRGLPDQGEMERVIQYFSSATLPLHHMHSKGYIHSDIKPGHLILNPDMGTMSLIDLECTIKIGEIICGMSKEYASPEQKQMIRLLRDGEEEKAVLKKSQDECGIRPLFRWFDLLPGNDGENMARGKYQPSRNQQSYSGQTQQGYFRASGRKP